MYQMVLPTPSQIIQRHRALVALGAIPAPPEELKNCNVSWVEAAFEHCPKWVLESDEEEEEKTLITTLPYLSPIVDPCEGQGLRPMGVYRPPIGVLGSLKMDSVTPTDPRVYGPSPSGIGRPHFLGNVVQTHNPSPSPKSEWETKPFAFTAVSPFSQEAMKATPGMWADLNKFWTDYYEQLK